MVSDYVHYIEANVVCFIIFAVLLVHDIFSMDRREKQLKFDHALISFMAYFVCDTIWACIVGGAIPMTRLSISIINFAIYVAMSAIVYLWLRFALAVEEVPNRDKTSFRIIFLLPFIIPTLGLIIVHFVAPNLLLNDQLESQLLYNICFLGVGYLYLAAILVYSIRRTIKEKSRFEKRKHLVVGILPLMVVIGGLIEMLFFPKSPIFCYCSTVLMVIFYIQTMQGQISVDPLTQLNNRGQLRHYVSQGLPQHKEGKRNYVIMFDLNGFKNINDTFGHAEGDRALVLVANSLTKITKQQTMPLFLARYGGDEFIIIAHADQQEEIDKLIFDVREDIKQSCIQQKLPYVLSMGAGYDELHGDEDTFQTCMQRADLQLYRDKEASKNHRRSA